MCGKGVGRIKTFSIQQLPKRQSAQYPAQRELAGGVLGDVGVYCINAARYVIGEEPVEVSAIRQQPL